jgi:hypothetical protein
MLSLGLSGALWANGGGYFRGGVEFTGGIAGFEPSATGNVRMIDENLSIRLGQEEAAVEVRYVMKNLSDRKVKVRFGFPVEEALDRELMAPLTDQPPAASKQLTYCRDYEITAGGRPVKATWQGEERGQPDRRFHGIAGWMVSDVIFAAGQELPVTIRFRSAYPQEEWSVSEDSSASAAVFRYRLSTAACWAGTIGSGRIRVVADGIDPQDLRILKPVNRFRKEGDAWVWNFEDLEPTLADDIEIEAQPAEQTYGSRTADGGFPSKEDEPTVQFIGRGERWSMLHSNYRVKASSTLKPQGENHYQAENLRDLWGGNAWSEGVEGPGIGEWLELVPAEAKPLRSLRITPGYVKHDHEGLFTANARPARVRVELNGKHRFEASIPDKPEEFHIPVTGFTEPARKIRLTVLGVYPGEKYEDLCVSTIRLESVVDRKPKVQPSR